MNADVELDKLFQAYVDAEESDDRIVIQEINKKARKIEGNLATAWHESALNCDDKKWFVAWIYSHKPVPKKLKRKTQETPQVAKTVPDTFSPTPPFLRPFLRPTWNRG